MSHTECGPGGTVCPKLLRRQLFSACRLQPPFPLSTSCAASPKSNLSRSFVSVISLGLCFIQLPDTEARSSGQAEKPFQKVPSGITVIKKACRRFGS